MYVRGSERAETRRLCVVMNARGERDWRVGIALSEGKMQACYPSSWRLRLKHCESGQHCEPSSEKEEFEYYGWALDKEAIGP